MLCFYSVNLFIFYELFFKNSFVLCFDAGGGQNLDLNLGLSFPSDSPKNSSVVTFQFKCFGLMHFAGFFSVFHFHGFFIIVFPWKALPFLLF